MRTGMCGRVGGVMAAAVVLAGAGGARAQVMGSGPDERSSAGPAATSPASRGDEARLATLRAETRAIIAAARDRVFPSLVNIDVVTMTYQGGKEAKSLSGGSGTIISADGYVLTNAHVTDEGHKFWCVLADKRRVPATLVGEDAWTDLAVLKLDPEALGEDATSLPAASFGDSDTLETGDYVLAMGSPLALSRTVTLGIVANNERVFASGSAGEHREMSIGEQRTGLFTTWIQHDALINPGNSGGPLVNIQGEVIGVNTRGGLGNSFATPSNMARQVAEALIRDKEVKRSWIGATFRHTRDTGIEEGALIDSVDADGPASKAGLRAGDVLTSIDGEKINARFVEEVPRLFKLVADRPIGATLSLGIRRDGEPRTIAFATEKLERDKGEEAALRTWGVTAQRITDRAAKWRRLKSTRGALVSSLRGDGPAAQAEPKLNWGDVIVSVDGEPTDDLKSLVAAYTRIDEMETKPEHVMIEFEREGKNYLTLIKPRPEERPDPPQELPKAWIGVATQPVVKNLAEKLAAEDGEGRTSSADDAKPADRRGFRVVRVYSGTKADEAGLRVGDIITAINGDRVQPKNLSDAGQFTRAVKQLSIDSPATLAVVRDGAAIEVALPLERTRQTPEEAPRVRNTDFELTVREITFFDREDMRWDESVKGVYVDSAEMAGWAGLGGVAGGDLIQRIGDHEITDVKSYKAAMESIAKAQPKRIVFVVFRGSRTYFRFVEPEWKPVVSSEGAAASTTP